MVNLEEIFIRNRFRWLIYVNGMNEKGEPPLKWSSKDGKTRGTEQRNWRGTTEDDLKMVELT